jgi:hypothetical protein
MLSELQGVEVNLSQHSEELVRRFEAAVAASLQIVLKEVKAVVALPVGAPSATPARAAAKKRATQARA